MSVSWDGTIKVWRSYRKQNNERNKVTRDNNQKFETWVWDQMKVAMRSSNVFDMSEYSKQLNHYPAISEVDEGTQHNNTKASSKTDES